MKKKILAIILASLMLLLVFASCKKDEGETDNNPINGGEETDVIVPDEDPDFLTLDEALAKVEEKVGASAEDKLSVMKIGGVDITYSQYRYYYVNYAKNFANYYGYDWQDFEDLSEQFNNSVNEAVEMEALVVKLAKEKGIGFSAEEFDTNILSEYDNIIQQYGDDYAKTFEDQYSITQYYLIENELLYNLYSKIQMYRYLEGGERYEDLKKQVLDFYNENDYIRAKHILVKFPSVNEGEELTEEQKAETLAKATEVLEKAKSGEDFDSLLEEFNEDPGASSNPDGYYFGKGRMTPAFEEAAYALGDNEISELVETEYGFHIIKRLPIEEGDIAMTDKYYELVSEDFRTFITEQREALEKEGPDEALVQPIYDEANAYIAELKQVHDEALAEEEAEKAAEAEEESAE